MPLEPFSLRGRLVNLEPLEPHYVEGLVAASAVDPSLYEWSAVPLGREATVRYVESASALRDAGTAMPFAIVSATSGAVIGSSRFFDMERWLWPEGHPRRGRGACDVCEIGYTWFTRDAVRTGANTETKLLMLTHAFEVWDVLRVCLHTDERNERSRRAMERMGGRFEGILSAHRLAVDNTPRNSARYAVTATEWPEVKSRLQRLRDKYD
jgi:RimJ/RimL family protein N-acetyltransferase